MKSKIQFKAAGRRMAVMALAGVVIAGSSMITACTAADNEPVIAERTSAQTEETDPDTGQTVTGGSESGGSPQSGAQSQQSLSQQVEAPDRCQINMESQYLEILADVPVTVPDVTAIPVRTVEQGAAYTDEDLEHFKNVLSQAEGIKWGGDQFVKEHSEGGFTSCESVDGVYYLSFRSGAAVNGKPKSHSMWINNKLVNAGSSADYSANDLSGMKLSPQEQEQTEQKLQKKAESVLDRLGLEDFQMTGSHWKQVLKYDNKWVPDGRYAVAMRFSRTVGGVPEPANRASVMGMTASGSQYVDIVYADDGQLLEFKNINREKYGEAVEESGFLLPFESVSQIFQQYCKNYYETNRPGYITDDVQPGMAEDNRDALAHMILTGVKLEYMPIYDHDQNGVQTTTGKIVPVWNFYGGMTVGFKNESKNGSSRANLTAEPDMLLLSVDARDGKVYGK